MKHKGKISGLLFGNIIAKLDERSFGAVLSIYIIQMILSYYFGHRYDQKQHGNSELQEIKSREFMVSFFGKLAALSERNSYEITIYIISIKEWRELIDSMQDKKINELVRKSDVVTKWEENKYVIIAVDNGYMKSTLRDRILKSVEEELEDDVVNITLLFDTATYAIDGRTLEELLSKAKTQLY
ncbi:diguanylate cyclase [Bacillus sp. Xin]|uniref:diguanylate cyclase n=1 Tax=unclassified Bacillus (in: firmicutes) TaxID=185979 RepID=UPI0015741754|nr:MULTISPECIES: diguanylate cyclase [unclassified Bacillus (in: firmicutes)]MBC6974211.1 diguanylate cyclase [Bacillus sp. Xin]NSW35003.1 diguanylate cyclase [Bacillus sp. Xin1]